MPPESTAQGQARYLVVVRMGDANFVNHVIPIFRSGAAAQLTVVRPEPRPPALPVAVDYQDVASRSGVGRVVKTLLASVREARRPDIKAIMSFNAVPYGVVALIAGKLARKPVHVGFVGTDAHRLATRWWGRIIDPILKRANWLTVPGDAHIRALTDRSYPADRLAVLSHGIDTARFRPLPGGKRSLDLLFVGRLVAVKRVEDIIRAVEQLSKRGFRPRLAIVGDGPERPRLENQVEASGLESLVHLEGFQTQPLKWYQAARILVLASRNEGLPFAVIESMACGVVPVVSAVGDLPELIQSGVNGLLFQPGDVIGLTDALETLLTDADTYRTLQAGALRTRESAGYETATNTWRAWLESL